MNQKNLNYDNIYIFCSPIKEKEMNNKSAEQEVYVFLASVSSILETVTTFKDRLTKDEKHSVNMACDNLRRIERAFQRSGLTDHPSYDAMVEVFNETFSGVLEQVKGD